jgi:hypothetical protein
MSKRWRGSRAARASPDDVHIRQAVACRVLPPGHGQRSAAGGIVRHGLGLALTIRERQGQGVLTPCPPRIRKAARHRPVSTLTLTAGRRWPGTRGEDLSGGWLGRSSCVVILLPAEPAGAPPPPSSRRTLRQAPGGLPPAWTGTLTIHPVTGVRASSAPRPECRRATRRSRTRRNRTARRLPSLRRFPAP